MSWDTFSRPYGTARWHMLTQDYVLGYSQLSLRDSILERASHRLYFSSSNSFSPSPGARKRLASTPCWRVYKSW
jgi:hypothetical protein